MDKVIPEAKDWKEISFRGMIQDILGNEIFGSPGDKLQDRTIFYCITIPGENEWIREKNGFSKFDSTNGDTDRKSFSLVNYSYPIPDGQNKSCLIKVYETNLVDRLRVNDIVHVTGVVEPNEYEDDSKLLTNKNSPKDDQSDIVVNETTEATVVTGERNNNANPQLETLINPIDNFEPASDFPHHLVPRVHVRTLKKLTHINPLLPDVMTRASIDISRLRLARARLSTILTQLFGGDTLVTEYLILSLISKIHRRKDVTTLGQLTIGLSGFKPEMKFLINKLYELVAKITTHSHYIDLSIANLNNLRFTPYKDHDNNKMIAGTLQLPDGLYLMLNETALTEGLLTPQGTSNVETLNQIIRRQRHNYDFKFHSVEIDTDLKVLVISEGKSVLNVPYNVPLEKNDPETISSMRLACESVDDFLNEDLLNMFRYYITALQDVPEYTIPEEVQKLIQEDFCLLRKESEANGKPLFSASDLSSYITLARYLTISRGETLLTSEIWREICLMESARTARIAA